MIVHTVMWSNAYGDHKSTVCANCAKQIEHAVNDNAQYNSYSYRFEELNDWHEGNCDRHDYESPETIIHKKFR